MAFITKLERDTIKNTNYRNVIFTSPNPKGIQLVLMNIKPKEEIGLEVHTNPNVDQFIKVEHGSAKIVIIENYDEINEVTEIYYLDEGDAIVIPAGTYHNVINPDSRKNLKLYSIYTPPEHPKGLVQKIKVE
jgi:mannose-6-phosphate isomerase-like protein (cupin superfamily)